MNYTNHLKNESSPYLLQHAKNPVDWYPWGEEALNKAKEENKYLIISVGYSACHWCHVMEHQSFEDEEVAKLMNEHFVSIKVDREERPDIDQIYMDAAHLINGQGGWPLNAFTLPDGKPFYAGTYFPKENWIHLLKQIIDLKEKDPKRIVESAEQISLGINRVDEINPKQSSVEFKKSDLDHVNSTMLSQIDFILGGQRKAPKFPLPTAYEYLLNYHYFSKNEKTLEAVEITLDKMAQGGIYDHIGGGFARYSTDEYWKVPHFEKMLYDNAQLISLYSNAYKISHKERYRELVEESVEFIKRELMSKENLFYSALDADSEGVEGKFYIWSYEELKDIWGEDYSLFADYYNIMDRGNWEDNQNILFSNMTKEAFVKDNNISLSEFNIKLNKANNKLLNKRSSRVRPGLDDKILSSWNALMIQALVDAYSAFGNEEYLEMAIKSCDTLLEKQIFEGYRLYRNYKSGKSSIHGFLDDYALLIQALISLYQVSFEEKYIEKAKRLSEEVIIHFQNKSSGFFYYTSDQDEKLITRKTELSDNVIAASNSIMCSNLFKLGKILAKDDLIKLAQNMLKSMKEQILSGGFYYSNWASTLSKLLYSTNEIVIIGDEWKEKLQELNCRFLPDCIFLGGKDEGSLDLMKGKKVANKTLIYVCKDKTCKIPCEDTEKALEQIL